MITVDASVLIKILRKDEVDHAIAFALYNKHLQGIEKF